jgi:DNA-binding HxlR family transcriptional regulator
MRGYGQYCPVAKGAEVFAERWTPLLLRELLLGSTHFSELHRGVPLMSRSLLSLRLKQLEEIGVVRRKQGHPKFDRNELDVTLLMWDMRRCIKMDAFPSGHIAVQFDFTDLSASKRRWWLVSDGEEVDLCPTNPGYEVGLYVATDLRTMTRVFMGDLSLKAAIGAGNIELHGPRDLCQRFERWLGLSGFAGIENARRANTADGNRSRSEMRLDANRSV